MDAHEAPSDNPKVDVNNMLRSFEMINSYLSQVRGDQTLRPLSYVTREDREVEDKTDVPAPNYSSLDEETTSRAPHFLPGTDDDYPDYIQGNIKVAQILRAWTEDTVVWAWTKASSRVNDGRGMYHSAYNHYMGSAANNNTHA